MSTREQITAFLLWLALFGLTLALSSLAAAHDTLPGDVRITTWAQDLPFPGEPLSDAVRAVSATEVALAGGGATAVVLWLRGYRRTALLLAVGLVLLPILQASMKELIDRPRPDPDVAELRASFSSPSFPSGHVMSGTYFYAFLCYLALGLPMAARARWGLAVPSLVLLALGGPANVYLGVHWPSDVLGGYAWALVLLTPLLALDRTLSSR